MASDVERYRKFGNNYFKLETPDGDVLTGVLTELPPFNFSTKWEDSPAASIGDELYKLVNKPEIEYLATTVQGAEVMRRTGNLTSKVYENAEPVSFELKFRCYPDQPFGDDDELSTAFEWIDTLKATTTINTSTNIEFGKILGNLKEAGKGAGKQIFGIVDDVKGLFDNSKIGDIQKLRKQAQDEQKKKGIFYKKDYGSYGSKTEREIDAKLRELHKEMEDKEKKLKNKLDTIENKKEFDPSRTVNSVKNYGASLFRLRLYPFMFNNPFIVYIPSWSVKPSKEYNVNEETNYYFEFSITCTMDQIPSAKTWNEVYL